jgi:peptidoglycan/LPS O-acetylase OafA/YrhL
MTCSFAAQLRLGELHFKNRGYRDKAPSHKQTEPVRPGEGLQGYRPQLDSLRAIAVTPVLLAHFWLPNLQLSSLGVRLFFVLSGFLLTGILLREREDAQGRGIARRAVLFDFYARRVLRIWPAYYFALIAAVVMGANSVAQTFVWHALFASNILFFLEQQWFPGVTAPLWTLAVEEQFYLVLPLAVLFVSRKSLRWLFVGCILAAIAYRLMLAVTVPGNLDFDLVLPIAQLDALGGGALLALIQHMNGRIAWRRLLAWSLAPAAVFYAGILPQRVALILGEAIYLLPMAALIAGADAGVGGVTGRVLSASPIVALGRISYGIYLYHLFVAGALDKLAERLGYAHVPGGPYRFLLFFCATIAVATLSWIVIERPALGLRRYFRRAAISETVIPAAPA